MSSPLPPVSPSGSSDDSAAALLAATNDLADALGHASVQLYRWRRSHADSPDLPRLHNLEDALDRQCIALRAQAIRVLGEETDAAVAGLRQAAVQVDGYIASVDNIAAQLDLVSGLLGLGAALMVGDARGLLTAARSVAQAAKAAQKAGGAVPPAA